MSFKCFRILWKDSLAENNGKDIVAVLDLLRIHLKRVLIDQSAHGVKDPLMIQRFEKTLLETPIHLIRERHRQTKEGRSVFNTIPSIKYS